MMAKIQVQISRMQSKTLTPVLSVPQSFWFASVWGSHIVVLRADAWLYAQGSLYSLGEPYNIFTSVA